MPVWQAWRLELPAERHLLLRRKRIMPLPPETVKRTQDMIAEIKILEQHIEGEIISRQIRLDEHRKSRAILQDFLEEWME